LFSPRFLSPLLTPTFPPYFFDFVELDSFPFLEPASFEGSVVLSFGICFLYDALANVASSLLLLSSLFKVQLSRLRPCPPSPLSEFSRGRMLLFSFFSGSFRVRLRHARLNGSVVCSKLLARPFFFCLSNILNVSLDGSACDNPHQGEGNSLLNLSF